ncbi:hypothetical protein SMSP2_02828 [Limihaloglobus sulfuriphilus]|uniref:PEP-CTERM protein-sorting domain-containing protein n=1 Tax=Limihaloglobus sulfuriphilus TaxID=1851148 RepID=A0A1R7T675_9BACT|nr:hypothetical protein [Limihaloglobus sulfuriphilus]AQQ72443.1 hypothetical protein SMSP2_02828 [Limihaloglobus sulfuriphilus]
MRTGILILLAAATVSFAWDEIRVSFSGDASLIESNWNTITNNDMATYSMKDHKDGSPTGISFYTGQLVEPNGSGNPNGAYERSYWTSVLDSSWTIDESSPWISTLAVSKCIAGQPGGGGSFGPVIMRFQGLDFDQEYSVEIAAARDHSFIADIRVGGTFRTTSIGTVFEHTVDDSDTADRNRFNTITDKESLSAWNYQTALQNDDWLVWDSVSPNEDGELLISSFTEDSYVFVNAIRLTPVPEPATFVVFFIGGLIARRHLAG